MRRPASRPSRALSIAPPHGQFGSPNSRGRRARPSDSARDSAMRADRNRGHGLRGRKQISTFSKGEPQMRLAEKHELRPGMPPPYPPPQAGEGRERREGARDGAATAAPYSAALSARTRILIEAPIAATLVRLAAPNVLVMVAQASVGLIETYFVGRLGTDALAGVSLVFPAVMLMQMMSAGAMGGGISSAIARVLGAGRRADADALVLHAMVIAVAFGLVFTVALLGGGRWL